MLATVIVAGVLLGVVVVFLAMLMDLVTELRIDFMEYWKDFEEFWERYTSLDVVIRSHLIRSDSARLIALTRLRAACDDDKLAGAGEDDDDENRR